MSDPRTDEGLVDELADEFARRLRAGEQPSVESFTSRHPELAGEIREVLLGVEMMERLKPQPASTDRNPPPAERPPEWLGEYRILREIGRGGMGVVYEAEQPSLARRVAVKVLPSHLMANEKSRARFRREARAAARLRHENIVPVFAVADEGGHCFYVMQLIDGRGLNKFASLFPPPGRPGYWHAVARAGRQVAEALAYAHGEGVLHRDIKPSNLLLDADGKVWLTDFGVAKLAEEADLTQTGDVIGTLRYMPPEQFAGRSDARSDVYSLGATLYELLTSRAPFADFTPHLLMKAIAEEEPTRPRLLKPGIPRDLETVILKAMARDPAQHYQTAADLAADLGRFIEGRSVLARRAGPLTRAWRWCRRNPALTATGSAALLFFVALTAVSWWRYWEPPHWHGGPPHMGGPPPGEFGDGPPPFGGKEPPKDRRKGGPPPGWKDRGPPPNGGKFD